MTHSDHYDAAERRMEVVQTMEAENPYDRSATPVVKIQRYIARAQVHAMLATYGPIAVVES